MGSRSVTSHNKGEQDHGTYWTTKQSRSHYGANHGIGAATARAFAAGGAAILINYLRLPPLGDADQESTDTPLGCVGQPEDVADVIIFLASEQARWLTGQILFVGGHRML